MLSGFCFTLLLREVETNEYLAKWNYCMLLKQA